MNWIDALSHLTREGEIEAYVLLTVLETKGSSPRDTGTKMVVTANALFDTIGGGALEFEAVNRARELLSSQALSPQGATQLTHTFHLGKDLKQCCGGVVRILFEVFPVPHFNIVIFGAGHIGKAVVHHLKGIDCHVKWFDARTELFPQNNPSNIELLTLDQPDLAVESCPPQSYYLVMTHDHALDQSLCEAILSRHDGVYCGLIGSATKGLKFRQRLLAKAYSPEELERLQCPAGLAHFQSKIPAEIAISLVAKLLKIRNEVASHENTNTSRIRQLNKAHQ